MNLAKENVKKQRVANSLVFGTIAAGKIIAGDGIRVINAKRHPTTTKFMNWNQVFVFITYYIKI